MYRTRGPADRPHRGYGSRQAGRRDLGRRDLRAVTEGKDGCMFPVGDVESTASQVLQLVGDAVLWTTMSEGTTETNRMRFDLESNVMRFEEI